jgi:Ser/Thr protein kinase RdoA (MazF antagonist)
MEELVNGFCGPAPMTDEEIDEAVTASEISQMEREQDANETWNKQNEDCGHVMTDEEYAEDCEIFAQAMEDAWGI